MCSLFSFLSLSLSLSSLLTRETDAFRGKRKHQSQIDLESNAGTQARGLEHPQKKSRRGRRGREEERRRDASRARVSYLRGNHSPAWRNVSERSESQHYKYKRFERRVPHDARKTEERSKRKDREREREGEGDIPSTDLFVNGYDHKFIPSRRTRGLSSRRLSRIAPSITICSGEFRRGCQFHKIKRLGD